MRKERDIHPSPQFIATPQKKKWLFWLSIDTREDQNSLEAQSRAAWFTEWVPVTIDLSPPIKTALPAVGTNE